MRSSTQPSRSLVALLTATVMVGLLTGCASQTINVFADASALPDGAMSTASSEAIAAADKEPHIIRRDWEQMTVRTESGTVTHWPIWMENAAAERGSSDGKVAVTWEDLNATVYCPLRFCANLLLVPVSAIVDPPGTVMASDGLPGKRLIWQRLDAKRSDAPGPATFVPVAARASQPPSTEPVEIPAQPIPHWVEY